MNIAMPVKLAISRHWHQLHPRKKTNASNWLGGQISFQTDPRQRIVAAAAAIHSYDTHITDALINGTSNRTHSRDVNHENGNILSPLNLADCVRITMCHYNTLQEVAQTPGGLNDKIAYCRATAHFLDDAFYTMLQSLKFGAEHEGTCVTFI